MKANKKENKEFVRCVACAFCKFQDECNSNQFGQGCGGFISHSKYYYL